MSIINFVVYVCFIIVDDQVNEIVDKMIDYEKLLDYTTQHLCNEIDLQ
jgi:hypothetical protein